MANSIEVTFTEEDLKRAQDERDRVAAELAAISPEEMANRQSKARFDYIQQQLSSYENRRTEFQKIPEWQSNVSYQPGDEVRHEHRKFIKADDNDQSPPDYITGGWIPL
jgi:uncharacterized protein YigA (DUF484 family)